MATLTDEERAAAVLGDVEGLAPDETPENPDNPDEPDEVEPGGEAEVEAEEEPEKPEDSEEEAEAEPESSFTKQFPNLKGDTLEDYKASIEEAYDNSFKEALRLVDENKQLREQLAQAQQQLAVVQTPQAPQPGAPAPAPSNAPQPPVAPPNEAQTPDWAARAVQRDKDEMLAAFDPFKKEYPLVLEPDNFKKFTDASDGVKLTMTKTLGRVPTWPELYNGIAGLLGWQPETPQAKKNAAIKAAATSSRSPSGQAPARPKPAKVSEAQVDAYLKMFTSKTREDAIKELSEVV